MAPPKGFIPWNKGKTIKDTPKLAKMAAKAAESQRQRGTGWTGRKHSEETKKKMAASRKALYASGWEPICGRCKKIDYVSPIAGTIKVDGSWELLVAKYLDRLGVKWKRNKQRFAFVNLKGTHSTYQPDFFVEEWNTFIEVKGYETDLDRAKWGQFPHELQIWKKDKIKQIEEWVSG